MNAEIITIGNELLNGTTINTNASWMADRLWRSGILITRVTTVGDEAAAIQKSLHESLEKVDLVLLTGGLGPTHDDITKVSIAEFLGDRLIENRELRERIVARFADRGVPMPEVNLVKALVPESAYLIGNEIGTAAGFYFEKDGKICVLMPGVPAEMKKMMIDHVLPLVQNKFRGRLGIMVYRLLRTTGIYESKLYEMLEPVINRFKEISFAFLPHLSGVDVRLGCYARDEQFAVQKIELAQQEIINRISPFIYEIGERSLEEVVAQLLLEKNFRIAVAESCTGGLIHHLFTNIPGSSQFLLGGVIAYDNKLKISQLQVKQTTLQSHGAVSEETAREMVLGVQKATGGDCALATTGIAGPTGGSPEKPVGLIYIGCALKDKIVVKKFLFHKERLLNKHRFTYAALNLLRLQLEDKSA